MRKGKKRGSTPSHLITLSVKMCLQVRLKVTDTATGKTRGIILSPPLSCSCPSFYSRLQSLTTTCEVSASQ